MVTGEVLKYYPDKGFGFIKPDSGGGDVLIHVKDLAPGQDRSRLHPGASVSFEPVQTDKGVRGTDVRFIARSRRMPAFSPLLSSGECDVLTPDQFDQELRGLLLDGTSGLREALARMARDHGWVSG